MILIQKLSQYFSSWLWIFYDLIFMWTYRMIQLVSDVSWVRCVCYSWITLCFVNLWEIHCYPGITLCCQTRAAHIRLYSCNHDHEHIMIIHVNNCFNSIACQISWFCEFSQFMNYVVLIIWIWISCHICLSNHEYIIQYT